MNGFKVKRWIIFFCFRMFLKKPHPFFSMTIIFCKIELYIIIPAICLVKICLAKKAYLLFINTCKVFPEKFFHFKTILLAFDMPDLKINSIHQEGKIRKPAYF